MKLQIIATLLIWSAFSQIDHTAIPPVVVSVKITPKAQSVPKQHSFKQTYESLGFQISGQVFETDQQLSIEQIYNSSAYSSSTSCDFYNSQLSADVTTSTLIGNGSTIESSYVSKTKKLIFLLVSNDNYDINQNVTDRSIVFYTFDNKNINLTKNRLPITQLGLNASENIPISFAQNNNVLLVTDGVQIIGINIDNPLEWWKVQQFTSSSLLTIDYQFARGNPLINFQIMHTGSSSHLAILTIAWNLIIKVFSMSADSRSVDLIEQLSPPSNSSQFYDVICQNGIFYGLVQNQLVVFRPTNGTLQSSVIQLQSSQCFWIDKYETTLHIICKEGGINYVAEFFFNISFADPSEALKLNRYYTQIGDANLLSRFGGWQNPKLLISGGDQLLITPYGINRQVLLEANRPQITKRFRGLDVLGIQQIQYIEDLSTLRSALAISIGVDFISILNISEYPAQIECYSDNNSSSNWNVLVQINTTSCLANGDIEQLQSICQISIPYIYQFTSFEVQSSKQTTVTLLVLTVLGVITMILLGCAFHCKTLRTKAMNEVKKKLAKLQKNSYGPKPI